MTENQFDALQQFHQPNKKEYNEFVLSIENQIGILSIPIGGVIKSD